MGGKGGGGGPSWADFMALQQQQQQPMRFPEIMMPAMPEMPAYDNSAFEKAMAQQQATAAAAAEQAARDEGISKRDSAYSNYLDAVSSSTDYINNLITDEMANAALLGLDYKITDEQKQERINNYFASQWGEGQQSELEGLMNKWGDPEGFNGWLLTRGDASKADARKSSTTEPVAVGKGQRPTLLDTTANDEDVLGGKTTVLGGGA